MSSSPKSGLADAALDYFITSVAQNDFIDDDYACKVMEFPEYARHISTSQREVLQLVAIDRVGRRL